MTDLLLTDFLLTGPNLPFVIALGVMLALALLEAVGMLFGGGLSHLLDSVLPDLDLDADLHLDLDAHADLDADLHTDVGPAHAGHGGGHHGGHHGGHSGSHGASGALRILDWLHFGRVPAMALLVLFLTLFGLLGLGLQSLVHSFTGHVLPGLIAAPLAFLATLPLLRLTGGWVAELIPKDETTVVSERSFVGRIAVVTLGTARSGEPAQAKLRDHHGQTHYVMVEPDRPGFELTTGAAVRLIRRHGAVFYAIANSKEVLVD